MKMKHIFHSQYSKGSFTRFDSFCMGLCFFTCDFVKLFTWYQFLSKYHSKCSLPTAREGNVFRGVRLFTGVYLQERVVCLWGWGYVCLQERGGGLPPVKSGYSLVLTSSGGHCSGRYASYWNAFLL